MTMEDLRELIQDDIICYVDGFFPRWTVGERGALLHREELKNMICQIVVNRFKEYDVSSSDITT